MYGPNLTRHQYDAKRDFIEGELAATEPVPDWKDAQPGAQQQFKDDVDINVIVARFGLKDGSTLPQATDLNYFSDFSEVTDLQGILDAAREAQRRFDLLPANIREEFDHQPAKLWDYVNNPKNWDRAVEMGLLHREATDKPASSTGAATQTSSTGSATSTPAKPASASSDTASTASKA